MTWRRPRTLYRHNNAPRDELLERVYAKAEWRWRKAAEYPADARNERSARSLNALADHIRQLPDDDGNLRALLVLLATEDESVGPVADYMLSRCGFDEPVAPENFDSFLADLVSETADEGMSFTRYLVDADDQEEQS